ncbi:hypothetical protein Ciccas_014498, partial [Cichlidogyrus casuarinus]
LYDLLLRDSALCDHITSVIKALILYIQDLLCVPATRSRSGSLVSDESVPGRPSARFLQVPATGNTSLDINSDQEDSCDEELLNASKPVLSDPNSMQRRASSTSIAFTCNSTPLIYDRNSPKSTAQQGRQQKSGSNSPVSSRNRKNSQTQTLTTLKFQKNIARRASLSAFVFPQTKSDLECGLSGLASLGQTQAAMIITCKKLKKLPSPPERDLSKNPGGFAALTWTCEFNPTLDQSNEVIFKIRLDATDCIPTDRPWTSDLYYAQVAIVCNGENMADRSTDIVHGIFGCLDFADEYHHAKQIELGCILPRCHITRQLGWKLMLAFWSVNRKSVVAIYEEEITAETLRAHSQPSKMQWLPLTPTLQ